MPGQNLKLVTNISLPNSGIVLEGKRESNPETGVRGLEGSGRLRLPDF
jgi:hypothetical protein